MLLEVTKIKDVQNFTEGRERCSGEYITYKNPNDRAIFSHLADGMFAVTPEYYATYFSAMAGLHGVTLLYRNEEPQ